MWFIRDYLCTLSYMMIPVFIPIEVYMSPAKRSLFFCVALFLFQSSFALAGANDQSAFVKCETISRLENRATGAAKIAVRPENETMQASAVSEAGHFRVHYDTTGYNAVSMTDIDKNGVPDYVDSTLVYLEYAWDILVNQLGYREPMSDNGRGGGDEVDCYIKEFGNGSYGYSESDTYTGAPSSAYVFIDNNYIEKQYASNGMAGLRVTTAHEFFHIIQFAYVTDYTLSWWMEQTAVWMEEQSWPDINDYLAYLRFFFEDYQTYKTSIDSNMGNFMYGAGIWPMFLSKRFGPDIIKHSWETYGSSTSRSVSLLDTVIPAGLGSAFNEFSNWCYFTNFRANTTDFFPDSDQFPYSVILEADVTESPSTVSVSSAHMTSRFTEILFVGEWGEHDALRITLKPDRENSQVCSIILYSSPTDYKIVPLDSETNDIPLGRTWQKAILVTSCVATTSYGYRLQYTAEISPSSNVEDMTIQPFAISGVYPNPFNPSATLSFTLPESGSVTVSAYNAAGQKVADLHDGFMSAGNKQVFWKPSGLAGGVYFLRVTAGGFTKTAKTLYLK